MKTLKLICLLFFVSSPFLKADPLLTRWLPYDYAAEMSYMDKTPYDLLNTTNADRIFGAEYYSYQELLVEVFASYTKDGETFDQAANVYGRFKGEKILRIEEKDIAGYLFLADYFIDDFQEEKIRISFSLADLGNQVHLFKQWSKDQIETVHDLYNYELTFSSDYEMERFMIAMITKIVDEGDMFQIENTPCPEIYVRNVSIESGVLAFDLNSVLTGTLVINNGVEDISINLNGQSSFSVDYDYVIGTNLLTLSTALGAGEDLLFIDFTELLSAVVEKSEVLNLSIYPNPTSDYLIIEADAQGDFLIVNGLGQICKRGHKDRMREKIDIRDLNSGSYYIVMQENKEVKKGVFFKM